MAGKKSAPIIRLNKVRMAPAKKLKPSDVGIDARKPQFNQLKTGDDNDVYKVSYGMVAREALNREIDEGRWRRSCGERTKSDDGSAQILLGMFLARRTGAHGY